MLNKPAGIISASEDDREPTVVDLIDEPKRRDLFPVGRLDRDTEGLLLITNDGALSHRLLSPKHHVDKVYYVKVSGILNESDVGLFRDGLVLTDGLECMPADLVILSVSDDEYTSEAEVTVREGKFHQVKRMFAAAGHEVTELHRRTFGPLELDPALREGEWRELTEEEVARMTEQVEQRLQDLTNKKSTIIADFASMLNAYTRREINEQTVSVSGLKYQAPSFFSTAFVVRVIKCAGPLCAVGLMVILVFLILNRRKMDLDKDARPDELQNQN
jgi:16S rRNA pseudouridine516 synthase